jgi:hypothetical protein
VNRMRRSATAARARRYLARPGGPVGVGAGGGFMVQGAYLPLHGRGPSTLTIALFTVVGILVVIGGKLLALLVAHGRRRRRAWLRRRRRLYAAANAESRARALMSELCPQGWRAQLTLFGPSDELPPDAPDRDRARVALDWAELEDDHGRVAVIRRVWARSIDEALEAMVADRRTDETLEQIERGAVAEDTPWPDL